MLLVRSWPWHAPPATIPGRALLLACLGLLLAPPSWASPFDPHPLPTHEPFVEGWFVRVVDHDANVSAAVIVGAFSNGSEAGGFGGPAGEAWAALLLQKPGMVPVTRQTLLHGSAGDVNVTKRGRAITSPPVPGAPASFEYQSAQGVLRVTRNGSAATIDFSDADTGLRIQVNLSSRVPYSRVRPDVDGPEGYLPDPLLPTHYWVQSLASRAAYRISNFTVAAPSTATAASASTATSPSSPSSAVAASHAVLASGEGALAHFEANWGSTFPSGWIWAQAIADEQTQLVLTGGNFTIAGVTTPQWIVSFRAPQLPNGAVDFRTIDLDQFSTHIDCEGGSFAVNASATIPAPRPRDADDGHDVDTRRAAVAGGGTAFGAAADERLVLRATLRAPPSTFSAPLFVPGRGGFHSSPGSIESYVASAEVTVQRESDGVVLVDTVVELAALEFGGTVQCQLPRT